MHGSVDPNDCYLRPQQQPEGVCRFPGNKVPMQQLLKDLLTAYRNGVKTLYYHNTRDGMEDPQKEAVQEDDDCAGGACKI